MIDFTTHIGTISYSKHYLYSLIGGTVTSCFGVVEMNAGTPKQNFAERVPLPAVRKMLEKTTMDEKGVTVKYKNEKLYIDLHISVMYGVNVATVVKSIVHKVRFAVEDETDIQVESVNVYVDSVRV